MNSDSIGLVMCEYSHTPAVPVAVRVNGSLGEVRLVQAGRPSATSNITSVGERVRPGDSLPPPVMSLAANNCAVLGQGMLRSLCGPLCAWAGLAQHPLLI